MDTAPLYVVRAARTDEDLRQILDLQGANLRETLDAPERASQGFVSLRHDLGLLREMNDPWPHIVATTTDARGEEIVVAYALVMLERFRGRLPLLDPMFERLDTLSFRGRPLREWRWYMMGQICVAKAHRGRGIVERLYEGHRAQMASSFDLTVTEIDRANTRSMRAHARAGFETIDEYRSDDGREWAVIAMRLKG